MDIWKDGFGLEKRGVVRVSEREEEGRVVELGIEVFVLDFMHSNGQQSMRMHQRMGLKSKCLLNFYISTCITSR